jgi:hypothetical protein
MASTLLDRSLGSQPRNAIAQEPKMSSVRAVRLTHIAAVANQKPSIVAAISKGHARRERTRPN